MGCGCMWAAVGDKGQGYEGVCGRQRDRWFYVSRSQWWNRVYWGIVWWTGMCGDKGRIGEKWAKVVEQGQAGGKGLQIRV